MIGTPYTCSVCGADKFAAGRQLLRIVNETGVVVRSWAQNENNSDQLQCQQCLTRYVWNAVTVTYDQQPPWVPPVGKGKK